MCMAMALISDKEDPMYSQMHAVVDNLMSACTLVACTADDTFIRLLKFKSPSTYMPLDI